MSLFETFTEEDIIKTVKRIYNKKIGDGFNEDKS